MLGKLTSAFSSLNTSRDATPSLNSSRDVTPPPPPTHESNARTKQYAELAHKLQQAGVPVSEADCAACDHPCPSDGDQQGAGQVVEIGRPWSGKPYQEYVQDTYGSLGDWPDSIETDWDSELAGSSQGGRGRIAVVSTGKSDWERDHYVSCNGAGGGTRRGLPGLINRTTRVSCRITYTTRYLSSRNLNPRQMFRHYLMWPPDQTWFFLLYTPPRSYPNRQIRQISLYWSFPTGRLSTRSRTRRMVPKRSGMAFSHLESDEAARKV